MVFLLLGSPLFAQQNSLPRYPEPRQLDAAQLERHGLRLVETPHVRLVTDLPASAAIDELPSVITAAVPLWGERFNVKDKKLAAWQLNVFLIGDRQPFDAARLMPDSPRDEFLHGFALGREAWLYDQPSDYYRRHLLLHEATHSFMMTQLGGCGPGWYMEGMAELLGTHNWDRETGALTLGVMPASSAEASHWGRVRLLREARAENRLLALPAVMKIDNAKILSDESYAWVWALNKFLDTHPHYRDRFRKAPRIVLKTDFNNRIRRAFNDDWSDLLTEWQIYTAAVDYGYDIEREAIQFQLPDPASRVVLDPGAPAVKIQTVKTQAARGWQSTGEMVNAGQKIRFAPTGRVIVGRGVDNQPWQSEAAGITLHYHAGRPLGQLLLAIDDRDRTLKEKGGFLNPIAIAGGGEFEMPASGTIYLRVNDSPAELADNAGELTIKIEKQ